MTKTTKIQGLIVGGKPYSSSASYRKGNVVTYNNNAYIALQGTPDTPFTAQAPPTDADSNDYWMLFLKGIKGETGNAATVEVGTVASGTTASVTNSGTTSAAKFDFVLPKGDSGTAATVTVGTVTTGAAGSSASVTNSGTSSAAVLDITLPKGDAGTGATVVQTTGTSTENVMSQKAVTDALNLKKSGAHIYTPFINTERWDVSAISYRDGTVTIVTDATHTNTLAVGDKISLVPKFSKTNGRYDSLNSIRPSISGIKHLANFAQGILPATVTSIADNVITISAYTYAVDTTLVPNEWVLQRVGSVTSSLILLPDDVKGKPYQVEILSYGTNVEASVWFFGGIKLGYNNAANYVTPYWGDFGLCVPLQWERYRVIDGYVLFNNLVYDSFSTITNYNGNYQHKVPVMYPYVQAINNIDSVYIPSSYYYYGQMIIIKLL